ncbi:MAG TPA: hypothetical protein VGF13_19670 [Verrucomicrobiae bacterium]|jgi:hypothetical protein
MPYANQAEGRGEVCDFILKQGFLALTQDDRIPYATQREPAWMTDISWARKIGALSGIVSAEERNAWELNRAGANELDKIVGGAANGQLPVTECFLWSARLKRVFVPSYSHSAADALRPPKRRRRDSPLFYLTMMEELFRRGRGEIVAKKLTERLGRSIHTSVFACAVAHKEWEDKCQVLEYP